MASSASSDLPRPIPTLLAVLPVLTAGLYWLGLSYHQGYLAEFGVDDSMLPLAADKVLFAGFYSLFTMAFPAALYAVGAIASFVLLVIMVGVLSSSARVSLLVRRVRDVLPRQKGPPKVIGNDALVDKGMLAYGYLGGLVLVLLLIVLVAVLSANSGREQAQREMAAFMDGTGAATQVFTAQFPRPFDGRLVMCGASYCAVWAPSGTLLIKHDAIDRLVAHVPSAAARKGAASAATP